MRTNPRQTVVVPDPDPSAGDIYWTHSAESRSDDPDSLQSDEQADIAIIGAGYTGLLSAIRLARAGRRVVVLEERVPGYGASGRSAGHVSPVWAMKSPQAVLKQFGTERGRRLNEAVAASAGGVFRWIEEFGIDCDATPGGHLSLVHNPRKLEKLQAAASAWRDFGGRVTLLSAAQVAERAGISNSAGGWIQEEGGFLNPYHYTLGLARGAIEAGAAVHCQSTVTAIEADSCRWRVRTEGGSVRCEQVVIATNACSQSFEPRLLEAGYRIDCAMLASAPATAPACMHWHGPWGWADAPGVFGGMLDSTGSMTTSVLMGRDTPDMQSMVRIADRRFRKYFPGSPVPEWRHCWRGPLMLTGDTLPRLFELESGICAASGYNGVGITTAEVMSRDIERWVTEGAEATLFPVKPLKPAPLRRTLPFLLRNVAFPLMR